MTTQVQVDPFSAVRVKKNLQNHVQNVPQIPVQQNQPQQFENQQTQDPFSAVRVKEATGFPGLKEVGRHATRVGSRIAETIGGIPGDIESLVQSGLVGALNWLTGEKTTPESQERLNKKRRFPTSKELKEKSERLTGGFTAPQNEWEQRGDEIAQTVASLLGPMKFRKALWVGLGSELAKEGIKTAGLGEGSQEAGKLGTMFLLTTLNPRGAMKYASNQYDKANALSKGASINSSQLANNLSSLVQNLEKGVSTSSKNSVIKPAKELLEKAKYGKIPIHELTAAKRDINSLMGEPETLHGAKKLLKNLGKQVDEAIKPYEKINPEFSKAYRPANEIYGAVMQGNKASNFIKKVVGSKSVLGAVVAEAGLGHPEYILSTLGGAGAALGSAKTIDFFTRLSKSPELRKFYGKALLSAAKEDSTSLRIYEEKIRNFMDNN